MEKLKTFNNLYYPDGKPKFRTFATYDAIRAICMYHNGLLKGKDDYEHHFLSSDYPSVLWIFRESAPLINLNCNVDGRDGDFIYAQPGKLFQPKNEPIRNAYQNLSTVSDDILKCLNRDKSPDANRRIKREDIDMAVIASQIFKPSMGVDLNKIVDHLKNNVQNWNNVFNNLKLLEEYDPILFKDQMLTQPFISKSNQQDLGTEK